MKKPQVLHCAAFAALALLSSGAPAQCREVSGGRLEGLATPVIWHARVACGGSTRLWVQSVAGGGTKESASLVDDLLIIPDLEGTQTLSLAAQEVQCRPRSGPAALVFALGEWDRRAGQGGERPAYRAWRVDPATRKLEELRPRDVSCVLR